MSNRDSLSRVRVLSALVAASSLLVACGGGGSSSPPPPPPPPPPPASVSITGKAVNGALQGATACYDLNDNGVCDSGTDPASAATDASGAFTLTVLATDAGKHRVIVNVPVGAVDAESGPVTKAFTLVAPATGTSTAQSIFVSPLTTLVQKQVDSTGQTLAQATSFVQAQLNLSVSPLADFTAATNAANTPAANAARLVVKSQDQQATAVAAAVGQTDLSGGTVSQADVDKAVAKAVVGALPVIGAAAADPALTGLTGTALQTALNTAATGVVASTGLTPAAVVVATGIAKLPADTTASVPEAGAALAALQYTNANNWFLRVNQSTALDNTPDANGLLSFYDQRTRMQPYAYQPTLGVAESFANGTTKDRAGDLHWNGSAWVACALGQRYQQTPRDAQGRATYNSCDNYFKGVSTRAALDIAGQSMASVVTNKILPVVGGRTDSIGWRLDTALLGATTFPAGSKLFMQTTTDTETAPAHAVRPVDVVNVFSQAIADGGDARAGVVACSSATGAGVAAANLEEMIARYPGKPCVFNAQTNTDGTSTNPRESWGLTSISLGDVGNYFAIVPGTGSYYSFTGRMRVAFTGAGNATAYYLCYARKLDNSAQNCTSVGTGTYTITPLGDARVMTFNNLPAPVQRVTFTRLFVERGGKVYFGFRNPIGIETASVRLNLAAANAMLNQLNLPTVAPADAPKALTGAKATGAAQLKGVWGGTGVLGGDAVIFRFGANGEFLMAEVPAAAASNQRAGLEQGWFDYDPTTGTMGRLFAIDSNGDNGISHPGPGTGITSVTDTAININDGSPISVPRFVDNPSGIVGMWALGSATDFTAPHFVFFANGRVLSIHPYSESSGACVTATQNFGPPGVEWSDYTYNAGTGALQFLNKLVDTTGCTGVFDSAAAVPNTVADLTLTLAADGKTATAVAPDGTFTLYRITPR